SLCTFYSSFYRSDPHRDLHSFPTRRSSDLSVDSIPTSTDKEDHVSMGVTSGRKLMEVVSNVQHGLAIELLCNTQGLEFLRPMKTDRKSTRLNSSHVKISYAVFCLKKKTKNI